MGRSILGVLAGLVVGVAVVAVVETAGHRLIPPPAGMDTGNPAAMAEAMASLPVAAYLFVLAAWIFGAGIGADTAMRIARGGARWPGLAVGGFILAATLSNLWIIPHPWWVAVAGVAGIIGATLVAAHPRGAPAQTGE